MDRIEKRELVADLRGQFQQTQVILVAHYVGMTVAQLNDLRKRMRDAQASFTVTKNTLTRIALEETPFEKMKELFKGQTGVVLSRDPVGSAKAVLDYAKVNDKFQLLGGGLPGQVFDKAGIEMLSKMPSIDELRAKILGMIQAPASRLVGIFPAPAAKLVRMLNAPAQNLSGVIRAYSQKEAA